MILSEVYSKFNSCLILIYKPLPVLSSAGCAAPPRKDPIICEIILIVSVRRTIWRERCLIYRCEWQRNTSRPCSGSGLCFGGMAARTVSNNIITIRQFIFSDLRACGRIPPSKCTFDFHTFALTAMAAAAGRTRGRWPATWRPDMPRAWWHPPPPPRCRPAVRR